MWTDVIDLRDFYASNLGQVAKRIIRNRLRIIWPDVKGMSVLGLGYPTPYLTSYKSEASRVIAAMPARQGVLHWPEEGVGGLTSLVDEVELPFDDLSMDRILLVHALECSDQIRPLLREVWRVLSASGKLVIIVPNRRGIWARFERTPFGHGLPYSPRQLSRLLRDTLFTPLETHRALYVPPTRSQMVLSSAPALEKICNRFFPTFGGVVMTEATKQIYAGQPVLEGRRQKSYLTLPKATHGISSRDTAKERTRA